MIDINYAKDNFIKYTNNYDLNNEHIKRKQEHSLRVMNLCGKIAKSIKLSEEEQSLAELIGLLHDIARFEQVTRYNNFHDNNEFDHGDYGAEILEKDIRNYTKEEKYDDIIIKAVKNHNKYMIDENLNDTEKLYTKIVRDADKIDIIYECINIFWNTEEYVVENSKISEYVFNQFKKEKLVKRTEELKFSQVEHLCSSIAFIFDLNFKESYRIIKAENYINKIVERFNFKEKDTIEKMKEIQIISNSYIEKKIQ